MESPPHEPDGLRFTFSKELHENMIHHVLLPRELPQCQSNELRQHELALLALMTDVTKNFESNLLPRSIIRMYRRMFHIHCEASLDPKVVSEEINALSSGDMIGLHIRQQNCALLLYRPRFSSKLLTDSPAEVIAATFPASQTNGTIYGSDGEIQVDYPARSIKVGFSNILKSMEFSENLCSLNDTMLANAMPKSSKAGNDFTELRDVPDTQYVSQWLLAAISSRTTTVATLTDFPVVSKKYRDTILLRNAMHPFRRSAFWTIIKVFLQIGLTSELGEIDGKILYKLVMLKFMTTMCEFYKGYKTPNADIVLQMLAKTARRIDKLSSRLSVNQPETSATSSSTGRKELIELFAAITKDASQMIKTVREKLDREFNKLVKNEQDNLKLSPLVDIDFIADARQCIPKLQEYLDKRVSEFRPYRYPQKRNTRAFTRHRTNNHSIPNVSNFSRVSSEIEVNLYLTDVENWVLFELEKDGLNNNSSELRSLAFNYAPKAEQFYRDDPLGCSKMMLTLLKLVAILDEIATRSHPLLLSHHSGINSKIFDNLLLPQRSDMEVAQKLQQYFGKRNSASSYPALTGENEITRRSFSVRFSATNLDMQNVKSQILSMAERNIENKKTDWQRGRNEVASLRNQASSKSHEYYTNHEFGYTKHDRYCTLCRLNKQISDYRVQIYERPLPSAAFKQDAVVFELLIPEEIACLRDVLCDVVKRCYGDVDSFRNCGNWTEYDQIASYAKCNNLQTRVFLGSFSQLVLKTHRKLHPDSPFVSFVVENGYSCNFYAKMNSLDSHLPIDVEKQSVKEFCTLKVEATSAYGNLQWTLEGSAHWQNSVLAKQNKCSQLLRLTEFVNFGSLRADGHRLQLRNIYRLICREELSFEKPSVLSLILQTLWEAGPNEAHQWFRESHEDFTDTIFATGMTDLLENFINQQSNNWKHPLKLLMTVLIAVRIFELNSDEVTANRIVKLLLTLRKIAMLWIQEIETAIANCPRTASVGLLRSTLVDVAMSGSLTFFVHSHHVYFNKIFENNDNNPSLLVWMHFLVTLNNNILLDDAELNVPKTNKKILFRIIRNIGIQLEPQMHRMISERPEVIDEFIKLHWAESRDGKVGEYTRSEEAPQILCVPVTINNTTDYVEIDIITGEFLVNSSPVTRISNSVLQSPLYRRVFDNFVFEVQPKNQSFCTIYKYNNCQYTFEIIEGDVIITERRGNGQKFELIPHEILTNEIPYLLVQNHSHWWNRSKATIEFRPKSFNDDNFSWQSGVQYELDLKSGILRHVKTQRRLLDVNSKSFLNITKFLSRLESKNFIHILLETKQVAKVELVRMNLKFIVDVSKEHKTQAGFDVVSNEFSGMRVSLDQNLGTLIGLNNGLVLESVSNESFDIGQLLILPHGEVNVQRTNQHVNVDIVLDRGELRSPTFFVFSVNERCRYLKVNNSSYSASFYLAYLHAVTAHPIPDRFTGMTGTERALQILQSANSWSSAPYDKESFENLTNIAQLSPKREFCPKHLKSMQSVQWPEQIHAYAAQDSLIFIVQNLLNESQRLCGLHKEDQLKVLNIETNLSLNKREYFRCFASYPNCKISENVPWHLIPSNIPHIIYTEADNCLKFVRILATLYDENAFNCQRKKTIYAFLTSRSPLNGLCHSEEDICDISKLSNDSNMNLRSLWIALYEIARQGLFNREKFFLILALLAHNRNDIQQLSNLLTIMTNAEEFASIIPPGDALYANPTKNTFDESAVRNAIKATRCLLSDDYHQRLEPDSDLHDSDPQLSSLTKAVEEMWPCDAVDFNIHAIDSSRFKLSNALPSINSMLLLWNTNRKLKLFIDQVETKLKVLSMKAIHKLDLQPWEQVRTSKKDFPKHQINFDEKLRRSFGSVEVKQELASFSESASGDAPAQRSVQDWWRMFVRLSIPQDEQHLVNAGLYPRLVPSLIFPKILSKSTNALQKAQKSLIEAIAIETTREQRNERIAKFKQRLPQMAVALKREMDNEPHSNWLPQKYPEWLLFEIEMDLSIRPIQVEVAKRMIEPPVATTKHTVMQLNMGEGKTAVIVPIVAAVLANGEQLCQVTVLKSLFATNRKSLRQCLGGMLNRRVYTFPCRRDLPIERYIHEIRNLYEECKREKGIVVTLPEYRLSFQLKMYEAVCKGDASMSRSFLEVHKWLNSYARNILDESDAILQPKYQLIYTVGEQLELDGGVDRWAIVQALLKRVPHQIKTLWQKYGDKKLEFDDCYIKKGTVYGAAKVKHRNDVFPPCRILDEGIYNELKAALIDDFIQGKMNLDYPETPSDRLDSLHLLLSEKDISTESFKEHIELFSANVQNIILILSGLLKFDVLRLALNKRWRVNYGINEKGPRQMAIPFKAKDVAAEMTEFGHPDIAICLTHLSYYYSGLSDAQLYQAFDTLAISQNSSEIYEEWIRSVPSELVDESISFYTGVNLSDLKQRKDILFPVFRHNMYVIDYWLSNSVFPREAKTFANKLMCTAWDLCTDHMLTVSGFSGTNDTKNVLPMPISQNDLQELERTNENVRDTLHREENEAYKTLPANVSGVSILKQLVASKIPVLLDSGALMLELDNEQVAHEWLKRVPAKLFDAAVYFDVHDNLQAVDRNGDIEELESSVYRQKLDRCLVYLDDSHTRGTDLKFPSGTQACVTLSGEITRDKTVQACMRMRMLGQGHRISFWASYEADIRIRDICKLSPSCPIGTKHVFTFICHNSSAFEKENTVHWAVAAHNYVKKLSAHKVHEYDTVESVTELSKKCTDVEYVSLDKMYGGKESALLINLNIKKFENLAQIYKKKPDVRSFIENLSLGVTTKIQCHIPEVKRYAQLLDEEQEKELEYELEQELEEQTEIERPPPAKPVTPHFDFRLQDLFKYGLGHTSFKNLKKAKIIYQLPEVFAKTKLYEMVGKDLSAWGANLFTSNDFASVVTRPGNNYEFLRPVWWIGRIKGSDATDVLIVLSQFECNELLPTFRSSNTSVLHMFSPRLSQSQSNLLHNGLLQVTSLVHGERGEINVNDEVQLELFSGSMYFESEAEQNAYCNFLGLIPRPRSEEHQQAFENGVIKLNGFVPAEYREHFGELVNRCLFQENPVEMVVAIIEKRHQFLRKESHVASIVQRGRKVCFN